MNDDTDNNVEKTLVIFKPDSVQRGIVGEILVRFERVGLKIVGTKMIAPTRDYFYKHYEEIGKLDAKKSLFRIYRDTRFSKDKTPYKTNIGASLGMGKGSQKAGYYLHIEPGKSFLGGGIYMPESSALKAIRKEISLRSLCP